MKILFYLGHPAHFHLFKNLIGLLSKSNQVIICIKSKDVLEQLLVSSGLSYINIFPEERKQNKASIVYSMILKDMRLLQIVLRFRPDLMLGTSIEITHIGKLTGISTLVVNEDDFDVVPEFAKLGYPWATRILAPLCCRLGKWEHKSIKYHGYHEIAYLHPKYFTPDINIVKRLINNEKRFFILRFSNLSAYHDKGKKGITESLAKDLIHILQKYGRVFISSEKRLNDYWAPLQLNLNPSQVHHFLFYADLVISDSQTMTAEAAVLGTPSVRFNDFVGRISYLEELEHRYGLTFGFKTNEENIMLEKVAEITATDLKRQNFPQRRLALIDQVIDLTGFMYDLVAAISVNEKSLISPLYVDRRNINEIRKDLKQDKT